MSTTTLEQIEALPDNYPQLTPKVPDAVWARLESYIAWRFTDRTVVWIVEGCGQWKAPLTPATFTMIESWDDTTKTWTDITASPPDASPLGGYCLPAIGPYRFTATVGDDVDLPAVVAKAAQLLAAYMASDPGTPGATRRRDEVFGLSMTDVWLQPTWMARAMQNSGAGDLLRPYRRV